MAKRYPGWPAALLLFVLAPFCAELLSGSTPPREFFTPIGIPLMLLTYGGLAVLLREWAVARSVGPWGRVLLALAMGLFGLAALALQLWWLGAIRQAPLRGIDSQPTTAGGSWCQL